MGRWAGQAGQLHLTQDLHPITLFLEGPWLTFTLPGNQTHTHNFGKDTVSSIVSPTEWHLYHLSGKKKKVKSGHQTKAIYCHKQKNSILGVHFMLFDKPYARD